MKKLAAVIGLFTIILAACGQSGIENALNYDVGDFNYTNQDNQAVGLSDLEGKVWIADFIFTSCETVCPPMTYNMSQLQDKVKEEGIENVEFVSFSVDPTVDSPEALKDFANNYEIDFSNWHFLTGYTQEEIESFAVDSFKSLVKKPKNDDQVIHQTSIYLVDQNGVVMKDYDGVSDVPYEEIIADIKKIQ
ncbi:SCO family protein [Cytobacillus sp. FSL W7-1323]|uniref:SCO family protein n=1 Tax=Cytobacillus sp. FSL W7-1323 TaxID=2921700 RepID=UPI002788B194|nr:MULTISPECIES: SCO family protein [Cytobacillus]MDQ0184049.1 protein SCO1/2 [Cytobacillus kochii]MEA1852770.1 SCO family protein [Cytobacillus sp. OWB-43]MED1604356.1 SCO family protein [Cytobacillus kochii]